MVVQDGLTVSQIFNCLETEPSMLLLYMYLLLELSLSRPLSATKAPGSLS